MSRSEGPNFWQRLPQWFNQLAIAAQAGASPSRTLVDPQHIHLFFPPQPKGSHTLWNGIPYQPEHPLMASIQAAMTEPPLDVASFRHALEQVPTAQSIEFSGWGDPLEHPHIFELINTAVGYNKMVTRLYTHAQNPYSIEHIDRLLDSHLDHLIVQLVAHRPSLYSAIVQTRQPLSLFTQRETFIKQLMARRNEETALGKDPHLFVEVTMVLDTLLIEHLNEMIEYSMALGVDGIRFENYIDLTDDSPSLRTLYDDQMLFDTLFQAASLYGQHIRIELPPLMSHTTDVQRQCADPHTTVSLSQQLNVSPCSHHMAVAVGDNDIWNQHFWNHADYQYLRQVHQPSGHKPLPNACQRCPKNSTHYTPFHHR